MSTIVNTRDSRIGAKRKRLSRHPQVFSSMRMVRETVANRRFERGTASRLKTIVQLDHNRLDSFEPRRSAFKHLLFGTFDIKFEQVNLRDVMLFNQSLYGQPANCFTRASLLMSGSRAPPHLPFPGSETARSQLALQSAA